MENTATSTNVDNTNHQPAPPKAKAKAKAKKRNGKRSEPEAKVEAVKVEAKETPFEACLAKFAAAHEANKAAKRSPLNAFFNARSWVLNKVASQSGLSKDLVSELVLAMGSQGPVPDEDMVRSYLSEAKEERYQRRNYQATVTYVRKHEDLADSQKERLIQVARRFEPPRNEKQFGRDLKRAAAKDRELEREAKAKGKKPSRQSKFQNTCAYVFWSVSQDERYTAERRGVLLTWLYETIEEHLVENRGFAEAEAKAEVDAWISHMHEAKRRRDLRESMPRPKRGSKSDRPRGRRNNRSDVQELKPNARIPQYKITKAEPYEPPHPDIEALAKEILEQRADQGKPVNKEQAKKKARGLLIQQHCEEQRRKKKEAKRQAQEERAKAKEDRAKTEAAAKAKKAEGKSKGGRKAA